MQRKYLLYLLAALLPGMSACSAHLLAEKLEVETWQRGEEPKDEAEDSRESKPLPEAVPDVTTSEQT